MSIREQLLSDIKTAMKAKDTDKLEVLRYVNAQIKNKEIEVRPNAVSDDDVMQVFKKYIKQRKEAMEQFQKAGREDLVKSEKFGASIVEAYLPEMMAPEKVAEVVGKVVQGFGADSMKDMGRVMKEVLAQTSGQADGKVVSELVKKALS